MPQNTDNHRQTFVLETARVYVPGSLPKEASEAQKSPGGGCCGSAPVPNSEESSGCVTSTCGTGFASPQSSSCC